MAAPSAALTKTPAWDDPEPPLADQALATARRAIEGRFLEAGDILAAAIHGIGDLITALGQLSESLSSHAVTATVGDLSTAASNLHSLSAAHRSRRVRIDSLSAANAAVAACVAEMQPNLDYLRSCAVNIRISSGAIGAAGPAFSSFGQEITDRVALGSEQLAAFGTELSALNVTLKAASALEDELGRCCDSILPEVPDALEASSGALSAHHARIAGLALQVSAVAKDIQQKVGRTLSALQIGDITRQRIEHVELGLHDLERISTDAGLASARRRRTTGALRRLLQTQLRAATDDFHAEAALVCTMMGAIAQDAEAILQLKDVVADGRSGGAHNVLQQLAEDVDKALTVVARTDEGVRGAEAVNRSAVEAARALRSRIAEVQSVRADVKMMALNASLRCARIGVAGRSLSAIAMELREHADLLATAAGRTTSALEHLAAEAELSSLNADPDDRPIEAAGNLAQAINRIRDASIAMDQQLQAVAVQGGCVVQRLNDALGRLDFETDLGSALDSAMDGLRAPEDVTGGDFDDEDREILAAALSRLAASYTMAQERDVHRKVLDDLGLAGLGGGSAPPAPAADPFDDDGLF